MLHEYTYIYYISSVETRCTVKDALSLKTEKETAIVETGTSAVVDEKKEKKEIEAKETKPTSAETCKKSMHVSSIASAIARIGKQKAASECSDTVNEEDGTPSTKVLSLLPAVNLLCLFCLSILKTRLKTRYL